MIQIELWDDQSKKPSRRTDQFFVDEATAEEIKEALDVSGYEGYDGVFKRFEDDRFGISFRPVLMSGLNGILDTINERRKVDGTRC